MWLKVVIKLRVEFAPCAEVTKHQTLKTWGSGGIAQPYLITGLDEDEW
jgi:hypothetical protein